LRGLGAALLRCRIEPCPWVGPTFYQLKNARSILRGEERRL
jgi:hypothetical protein